MLTSVRAEGAESFVGCAFGKQVLSELTPWALRAAWATRVPGPLIHNFNNWECNEPTANKHIFVFFNVICSVFYNVT